ncbi:MAG: hypothetical protein ACC652_15635, partial [Acidimicrobiales bacterium]
LGRGVVFMHEHDTGHIPRDVATEIESLLTAGRAMDFAARLKDFPAAQLTSAVVEEFAKQSGIGARALVRDVLPVLQAADVLAYTATDGRLDGIEEYVGITGTLVVQAMRVLDALNPSTEELALLHSIEVASWAPLTESQHLDQLTKRGIPDQAAQHGYRLARAIGVNKRVLATELNERVVFNPYVWGTEQITIAKFLKSLPPNERDVMLGICEQASAKPGLALPSLVGDAKVVNSARKVGLLQATTVKSTSANISEQTYVFSPLLETEDDKLLTTEALHQRKQFVAHILFGHEKAKASGGRIVDPVVLVRALVNRGQIGPATNIGTDYHLLEAQGIVTVDGPPGGRAFLRMVKPEIVKDGLDWLERTTGGGAGVAHSPNLLRSPTAFVTPEQDRASLADQGAAEEVTRSMVLRLREEVQSATRQDHVI